MRLAKGSSFALFLTIAVSVTLALAAPSASAQPAYGVTSQAGVCPSNLYRIDFTTGAGTLVGPIVGPDSKPYCLVSAMKFDQDTGGLYAIGVKTPTGASGFLILVDPHTGAATEIGDAGIFGTDMAFGADGTLFVNGGSEADTEPHHMFKVDKTTGASTLLGITGATGGGNALTFNAGTLYLASGGKLYTVNQTTGAATPLANLNFPGTCTGNKRINAMDFRIQAGNLIGVMNCDNASWRLGNMFANGNVTDIGQTVDTLDALAFQPDGFSPARLWVGLKNSDDVGLRLDLKAEVFINATNTPAVAVGEALNVKSGSSGFNNAQLDTVLLPLADGATFPGPNDRLLIRVSVRRTCSGGGHTSGTVRFWYDGKDVDTGSGRDAGSRFDLTRFGINTIFYLRNNFELETVPGSSRKFIAKSVNSSAACPARPYTEIGTWTLETGPCRPNVPGC